MAEGTTETTEEKTETANGSNVTPTPEKPKAKTADKPHHLSLVLSIGAIIISSLSWWEGHQNRIINEEINRPVLSIARTDQDVGSVFIPNSGGSVYSFYVDVKNIGKATATILKANVEPRILYPTDTCNRIPYDTNGMDDVLNRDEVLPGMEKTLFGEVILPKACEQLQVLKFQQSVTITYRDVATGREYYQGFVSSIEISPVELKKKFEDRIHGPKQTPDQNSLPKSHPNKSHK